MRETGNDNQVANGPGSMACLTVLVAVLLVAWSDAPCLAYVLDLPVQYVRRSFFSPSLLSIKYSLHK